MELELKEPNKFEWKPLFTGSASRNTTVTDVKFISPTRIITANRQDAKIYLMNIYHLPHGLRKDRQYNTRIQRFADMMTFFNVKYIGDLVQRRGDGILEWKPAYKSRLNMLIKQYFENRKDDSF